MGSYVLTTAGEVALASARRSCDIAMGSGFICAFSSKLMSVDTQKISQKCLQIQIFSLNLTAKSVVVV